MRSITLAMLLALCGAAAADGHHAKGCAEAASGLTDHRAMARAMGMEIASAPITDEQIALWHECQRRLEVADRIDRLRAEVDANQIEINRLLGRLQPGEGYHIVYLPRGKMVHSPRAAYYVNGRATDR